MTVAIVKTIREKDEVYNAILVWCPGCEKKSEDGRIHGGLHMLPVSGNSQSRPTWAWNHKLDAVTLEPSILVRGFDNTCHSFLRDGVWEFLSDSTHKFSGQKVPMVELPEWLLAE